MPGMVRLWGSGRFPLLVMHASCSGIELCDLAIIAQAIIHMMDLFYPYNMFN